jgi:hypothetical protein
MNDEFRTVVKLDAYAPLIGVNSRVMLMGSCFAENIGDAFHRNRLPVLVNPTGIVYNPFSIARSLELLINNEEILREDLTSQDERWHSFDFHGRFSDVDPDQALRKMNHSLKQGRAFLKEASYLMLTLGTANVYERRDNGQVVANCHKFPNAFFVRRLLDYRQIVDQWQVLIDQLSDFNPNLNVVFTVSPVRHWKDGAHGNQVSKSVLFLAIDELGRRFDQVSYFPSYEIIMDELRDYRFYDESMLHPSAQAVRYVWSCFEKALLSPEAREYIRQTTKIASAREHRLLGQPTQAYRQFLDRMLTLVEEVETKYSVSHLQNDRLYFKSLLEKLYFD